MINLEELATAVRRAGGDEAAAARMNMSSSQVRRWLNGSSVIPRTRETTVSEFIAAYSADPTHRPLGSYSNDELLDELGIRLRR